MRLSCSSLSVCHVHHERLSCSSLSVCHVHHERLSCSSWASVMFIIERLSCSSWASVMFIMSVCHVHHWASVMFIIERLSCSSCLSCSSLSVCHVHHERLISECCEGRAVAWDRHNISVMKWNESMRSKVNIRSVGRSCIRLHSAVQEALLPCVH